MTGQPVGGIEECCRTLSTRVLGADASHHESRRDRRQMLVNSEDQECIGEHQPTTVRGGLKAAIIYILAAAQPMREMNIAGLVHKAGHIVPISTQLFRNGSVGYNDSRDCGSVKRPHEHGCRAASDATGGDRDAKETDTKWHMGVLTSVEQANLGAGQRTVGEKEVRVVCCTGHGAIVSMGERSERGVIICFRQAAKEKRPVKKRRGRRHGWNAAVIYRKRDGVNKHGANGNSWNRVILVIRIIGDVKNVLVENHR